jgi:hypothetical protein
MMHKLAVGAMLAVLGASSQAQVMLSENFDNLANMVNNFGWTIDNRSAPLGTTAWFQGNTNIFPGQSGGYAAANFNSASNVGTISTWLITPALLVDNGVQISFWTRTVNSPIFPDRLELRMSTTGNDLGSGPNDVGDFSTLLLSVNPDLTVTGYPETWTQYSVTLSGLSGPTPAKFAFRYYVTNGGPAGSNSDYIGIDTLLIQVPEPGTLAGIAFGLAAIARRRARK